MTDVAPRRPRVPIWKRLVRIVLAILLFIVGLIGVITPIMPQVPFFVAGLIVLSPDFPPARRAVLKSFRKWPRVRRVIPKWLKALGRRRPV